MAGQLCTFQRQCCAPGILEPSGLFGSQADRFETDFLPNFAPRFTHTHQQAIYKKHRKSHKPPASYRNSARGAYTDLHGYSLSKTVPQSQKPKDVSHTNTTTFKSPPIASRQANKGTGATRGRHVCRVMGMATAQLKGLQDNIFIRHNDDDCWVCGSDTGPLWGLTFALKDMYDVERVPTGFGNPKWKATHEIPTRNAPIVDALLNAGATLLGKTVMDEMAFSLSGANAHYGMPINPAAPGRIPGGSSSGSAAAVAAKLVDFAIGSDTAGSVRVPASHCGVLGMRPSHGRISMEGARPLQPSLDTVGWFANDPTIFRSVGEVLLKGTCLPEDANTPEPTEPTESTESTTGSSASGDTKPRRKLKKWLVASDAFTLADEAAAKAIYEELSPHVNALSELLSPPEEIKVASLPELGGLDEWKEHARIIQSYEAWQQHGEWIRKEEPKLGPGVRERFEAASKVTEEQYRKAAAARERFSDHVRSLVADGAVLAVPSAPGIAPLKKAPAEEVESYRNRILQLSVIAGPAGLPQVNLPIAEVDGCPVGFGFIGPRGWDEELLDLTVEIMQLVQSKKPPPTPGLDYKKFVVPLDDKQTA